MPKLTIDQREIEVPKGMKVIEAADRLGIIIPRFCYHPGLGPVGACRVCAVKFLEGPVKGIQMSCMVDAVDGMVVSTLDAEVVDFRRQVIEWLMMNHPHDCPVCDEGGQCLLQDMTVSGGHGIRRFLGKKRTYHDQYLGPLIQHEMNRCIHCWRCRRFYQDFAGYRDLGAMQIAYRTYFGRYTNGTLESPFAGNLTDICPTGVYTDKPSRFKGRRWEYTRSPSLCIHCSLGCHIVSNVRYREVMLVEALFNQSVNGYFICDRGRYGFFYANHPERPRRPRIGPGEVSWDEAIRKTGEKLVQITKGKGSGAVACFSSARASLESQGMLRRLCRAAGWENPGFFADSSIEAKVKTATLRLAPELAVSMAEIEKADFLLVMGADPVNEAPMSVLAMRQAQRKGASVVVIDPRPIFLPFPFHHLPVHPLHIEQAVQGLVKKGKAEEFPFQDRLKEDLPAVGKRLEESRRVVIICGLDIVTQTTPGLAADMALLLRGASKEAGLFYLMPGANAFGAGLLSTGSRSWADLLDSIEMGTTKALILVESDPFLLFPDRGRLESAIGKLDLLLVMDYVPSRSVRSAHIFLPTLTLFESAATFVNQEGRAQFSGRVHSGGIPIEQVSGGGHPPRLFRRDIPGNEPRNTSEILEDLSRAMSVPGLSLDNLWDALSKDHPVVDRLKDADRTGTGVRLICRHEGENAFSPEAPAPKQETSGKELELLLVDWTFGTEELSTYSVHLGQVEHPPCLLMHAGDAERLTLKDGDRVSLSFDEEGVEIGLRTAENMARGLMILPRHHRIPWQRLKSSSIKVPIEKIRKIE